MKKNVFTVKGIEGECYFDFKKFDTRDGLRVYASLSKYQNADVNEAGLDIIEASLLKIADIALKYLIVNGDNVRDIAGLEALSDGTNVAILTMIVERFLSEYTDFLE